MADEVDLAGEFQEQFIADSLQRQLNAQVKIPRITGHCLNCEEKINKDSRWCDTDCRDDWQRNEDSRRRKIGIAPVVMPLDDSED